jgi:phospholipid/cholesterol/gamma-HCH transport system permease protein
MPVRPIPEPDESSAIERALASIGRPVAELAQTGRELAETFSLTMHYLAHGRRPRGLIVEQFYEIGNRSVVFIGVTLGFLGMILVYQAGFQAMRITGDLQLLGGLFLQLLLREFAPTITAMMIATRVGTGIAAEIGSMVVTEQVDAMRMCAAQPIDYLVVPRFVACTVMTVVLTVFAVGVSYGVGGITSHIVFGLNLRTYFDLSFIGAFDVIIGLCKAFAYGMAIPIVSCHAGLAVKGGSAGVGRATTRAVVNASLAVVILDFVISGVGYVVLSFV